MLVGTHQWDGLSVFGCSGCSLQYAPEMTVSVGRTATRQTNTCLPINFSHLLEFYEQLQWWLSGEEPQFVGGDFD